MAGRRGPARRRSGSLYAVGNYFDAVPEYERAGRFAYGNRKIDSAGLEERLAKARKGRDGDTGRPFLGVRRKLA